MKKKLIAITIAVMFGSSTLAGAADKKVIIGFKKSATTNEEQKSQRIHRSRGHLKRSHKFINAISAIIPEDEITALKQDPIIAYIEPDVTVGLTEPITLLPLPPDYENSWGVTRIGGADAATAGFTGAGIKIAILDSGIDYSHPDLKDNYKGGYNFVYENSDPYDDGYISHGTHIAGIIGARNNGTGVVGVAPEASLYAVKVLGGMVMGDLSDILAGMEWSIANGMNVINLSIGAPIDSPAFKDACDRAYQAGILMISASGNNGSSSIEFPAAYDSVIAVGATNQDDTIASFSNYGPKIELAAPGVNINSTLRGGGYGVMKGTSQATAFVTGAAAVLLSKNLADTNGDGRNTDEVRALLAASATDLGSIGRDQYFGYGLINLTKALNQSPPANPVTLEFKLDNRSPLKVPLKPGTYKVEVIDLTMRLQILVSDISGIKRVETGMFRRKPPTEVSLNVTIGENGNLIFLPMGKQGSTAIVKITPAL